MESHLSGVLDEVNTDPSIRSRGQLAHIMSEPELTITGNNQLAHIVPGAVLRCTSVNSCLYGLASKEISLVNL